MRQTEHTSKPEILEYQPNEVTSTMEKAFHEMWKSLYEHQLEYMDSKWYKRSRTSKLIENNKLWYLYSAPGFDDYNVEIIPKSILSYTRNGLKADDLAVIWYSEYEFVAMTMYDFDSMYNNEFDNETSIGTIKTDMMVKLKKIYDETKNNG